jgi:hypothetical protein
MVPGNHDLDRSKLSPAVRRILDQIRAGGSTEYEETLSDPLIRAALFARFEDYGRAPEQMTVHTELTDDRSPGFLHLRLVRRSDGRCVDLALPDIPGEWTQALVATASSDRFEFMRSAEAIWIVLDGRSLADIEKRHGLIVRMGQLAARLKTMFEGHTPRLMVVVTHRDLYALEDNVAERLRSEFNRRDVEVEIVGVAPFSEQPQNIPAGFGLAELVNLTIGIPSARPPLWGSTEPAADGRSYLNFRRDR